MTTELAAWIEQAPALLGDEWLDNLDARKREEAHFHDADRTGHQDEVLDSTPNRRFYAATVPVERYVSAWIARHAPGHTFLDYACGNGQFARRAATAGASLALGIDISPVSVRNATENAAREGVRATFLQRDCEDTGLPAGSIDAVLCSGMLHHLDLARAFPELCRILKPGGRVLCQEALAYNPLIQWYRTRTPALRTAWEAEHILGLDDVAYARRWFDVEHVKFFCMASPLAVFLPAPLQRAGLAVGHALDAVLTRIPLLQRWSWQFSFELVKR